MAAMANNLPELGLDNCNNIPCFIPGVTTTEAALNIIESRGKIAHKNIGNSGIQTVYFETNTIWAKLTSLHGDPYVAGIEMYPRETPMFLGEFVELFGKPCVVYVAPLSRIGFHTTKFAVEYQLIRILCQDIENDELPVSSAAITLLLLAAAHLVGRGMTPNPCESLDQLGVHVCAWQGFLSVNEYRRLVPYARTSTD
jgi:hypothetical protein